eukprot:404732_1
MDCCGLISYALSLCCCCWCCEKNSYDDRDENAFPENRPKTGHWPNGLLNHPRDPWFYPIEEAGTEPLLISKAQIEPTEPLTSNDFNRAYNRVASSRSLSYGSFSSSDIGDDREDKACDI